MLPTGHEVFPHAVHIEYVWAPGCHDMLVVLQQFAIHIWQDATNDVVNISALCSVITSEIMHDKASVHFVMGKEHGGLVWTDFGLCGPVRVGHSYPVEVVIGESCDGMLKLL